MNALPQTAQPWVTEAEYLAYCEAHPEEKFELIDGEIVAMTGASRNHNLIIGNLYIEFSRKLKEVGSQCLPFFESLKVKAGENENFFYPDIVVDCSSENKYMAAKPVIIVEVLSNSTRAVDLTVKLSDYQTILTLKEYVIIEQDFIHVSIYRKRDNWRPVEYISRDDVISFESLDLTLSMMEIYDRVVFKTRNLKIVRK
ncbi:Uma2 family endonuclease [Conchiformibius steedae]|uniref:Uma2 family endonuclease n=1 Tax=Conchiformibius steedae TaxID=153493 RepID=A0A3P2A1E6_9NEIS|nr:Uma2 family endonuclease [Conchiformibius steedae]RRD89241.1 Uma2 family endonuclease [Conchiformibius steedae]